MNKLKGTITNITSSGNISLVDVKVENTSMASIVIGNPENTSYLKKGNNIFLLFKESEVSIGKDFQGTISLRNQLPLKVIEVKKGKVFSKIVMRLGEITVVSMITTCSAELLRLTIDDKVTAFIKANEVILMDPANE